MIDANYIQRNETKTSVFNPLKFDFVDEIRDDDNQIQKYTVPSFEIVDFPAYIAQRIIEDLIVAVMNEREISPLNEEKKLEIRKEIEI